MPPTAGSPTPTKTRGENSEGQKERSSTKNMNKTSKPEMAENQEIPCTTTKQLFAH